VTRSSASNKIPANAGDNGLPTKATECESRQPMAKARDAISTLRIPSDEKDALKVIADREDRSMTDIILRGIRLVIAEDAKQQEALAPATKPKAKAKK